MHRHDATIFGLALLVLLFQFAAGAPAQTAQKQSKKSTATDANVDLNTASEKDLETLPGVGAATAKKIIAARPYSSVDELSKSGIPASTIKKITPLVTVSGSSANSNATNSQPSSAETAPAPSRKSSSKSTSAPPSSTSQSSQPQGNPGPGMVWVNLDSGVYHYQGSHYYGKTKNGKYMSESEAISAGYRAAKNEKKPQ
jgi:hypothetical protein